MSNETTPDSQQWTLVKIDVDQVVAVFPNEWRARLIQSALGDEYEVRLSIPASDGSD